MRTLKRLDELDTKLRECDAAGQLSDDALREVFRTFRMDFSAEMPTDPFDPAYAAMQMRIYERIAGHHYKRGNEASLLEVEQAVRRPFPYATGSCLTAGHHLTAIGFLLRTMQLAPGARVLEFGPGWGNTTMALAQLGFEVTAVDIEPRFCELIRRRAAQLDVSVTVVNGDFFWLEAIRERFDAIVFFECFHHCADHMRLLRALHRAIAADGHVYFASEPIITGYPVPWGVRLDGESLWAIRKFGWLELGFSEEYFRNALHRTGWAAKRHVSTDLNWVTVWEAWRRREGPLRIAATDPKLSTVTGSKEKNGIRLRDADSGFGLFGPYVPLSPGRYTGRVFVGADIPRAGQCLLEVCAQHGERHLARGSYDLSTLPPGPGEIALSFVLELPEEDIELRLFCSHGTSTLITAIELAEDRG